MLCLNQQLPYKGLFQWFSTFLAHDLPSEIQDSQYRIRATNVSLLLREEGRRRGRKYILGFISVYVKVRDLHYHHTDNKEPSSASQRASTVELHLVLLSNEERWLNQCY